MKGGSKIKRHRAKQKEHQRGHVDAERERGASAHHGNDVWLDAVKLKVGRKKGNDKQTSKMELEGCRERGKQRSPMVMMSGLMP